jgi:2-polyprenyl-3-methyl-5-hydroxy-6-metoxy-1,4-benzoquinol methylase
MLLRLRATNGRGEAEAAFKVRLIDHYGPDGWGDEPPAGLLPRQVVARDLVTAALRDMGRPTLRVLDAGCGDGSFLDSLARHIGDGRVSFVGVDYSGHQLAKAARLPYDFHECDLGDGIPLPSESFDVVHAAEVIEHLYDPDLFVDECARVLRPGGRLVVTTPNPQAWYNRLLFLAGIQPLFYETSSRSTEVGAGALRRFKRTTRPVGHLRLFNRRALLDLLERGGFAPVALRGARYHDVPRSLGWLDAAFCRRPSMASILLVDAVRALDTRAGGSGLS